MDRGEIIMTANGLQRAWFDAYTLGPLDSRSETARFSHILFSSNITRDLSVNKRISPLIVIYKPPFMIISCSWSDVSSARSEIVTILSRHCFR
jgi:hypothetical protein